jgi:hypothetical protein
MLDCQVCAGEGDCRRVLELTFAGCRSFVCNAGVVSTGERNTLIFLERWSVRDEVSCADVLYEQTEI